MASNNSFLPFIIGAAVGSVAAAILLSDKNTELKEKLKEAAVAGLDAVERALTDGGEK